MPVVRDPAKKRPDITGYKLPKDITTLKKDGKLVEDPEDSNIPVPDTTHKAPPPP